MKKFFVLLFTLACIAQARKITTSDSTNTPYRERMRSSVSSAILVGVAGTATEGDTCVGTYVYTFQMHQFPVERTGMYLLYEDILGGTSYSRRTDWSTTNGKLVVGVTPVYKYRPISQYGSLLKASQNDRLNGGSFNVPGVILGEPGTTEYVADTTIHVGSNQTYDLRGQKFIWSDNKYYDEYPWDWDPVEFGNVLFDATNDSNITIIGGEYYGCSGINYFDTTAHDELTSSTYISINSRSNQFAADSLLKWYILITGGTGSGQSRRIKSNNATVGDTTLIEVSSAWSPKPDGNSEIRLTPMDEYQHAVQFNQCFNVHLKDMYIHDFPGDGMEFGGGNNIWVDNCIIETPYRWFVTSGYQSLVGRQGISLTGRGYIFEQPTRTQITTTYDTLRNVKITGTKIIGGHPGGIDIEPNGKMYIENLEISDCIIDAKSVGITVYVGDSTIIKNLTIKNNVIRSEGYGIYLRNSAADKMDSTTVAEAIDATEWVFDVADTSIFTVGYYVLIDHEVCRVKSKGATTITLYDSAGVNRYTYVGARTTHTNGTKIYKMTGPGRDYGYFDNINIVGNTIVGIGSSADYGIISQGARMYHVNIRDNDITNWDKGFELTAGMEYSNITDNNIYNNGDGIGLSNNTFPGAARLKKLTVDGNTFTDNGIKTDSSGYQLYLSGVDELVAKGNKFICTNDSTIARGMFIYGCTKALVVNNCSYGHANDDIGYWATTGSRISDNIAGFGTSSGGGAVTDDITYDYGNSAAGDTSAADKMETKRTTLRFNGYRDAIPGTAGAKIVAQNVAWPGFSGDAWKVQGTNLLFYTLSNQNMPYDTDDTRMRMMLVEKGIGLPDSSYIGFFDYNTSPTAAEDDSNWAKVGTNGYGLRELGGKLQAKNSGRNWYQLLSFIGAQNKTYEAEVGDLWFSSKRDTLWYKTHADSSWYILVDGNSSKH